MAHGSADPGVVLPVVSLWWREVVRFCRQPSRVVSGLGSPLLFWVLIGSGLRGSFRHPAGDPALDYLEYFFPGTLVLILLFTAILSTVSVIEDRREGFLQGVLVAPIPRAAMVLAKLLGGTTLATAQGVLFLVALPATGIRPTPAALLLAAAVSAILAFGLTGLGFLVAWPMESTQGFHAIMNLLLMPLWLLSGALFPAGGSAAWVRWFMRINPLSYGVEALRAALYWGHPGRTAPRGLVIGVAVSLAFGLCTFLAAVALASRLPRSAR